MEVLPSSEVLPNPGEDAASSSGSSEDGDWVPGQQKDNASYFRQCYRQPELLLPWDISVPQPDLKKLQKQQPELFASPILDCGAGLGANSVWLTSLPLDVVACDVSGDAMAECDKKIALARESRGGGGEMGTFRSVECNILDHPPCEALLVDGPFATVMDSACFHCVGGDDAHKLYAKAMAHLLRPGGCLIMLTYSDLNPEGGSSQTRRISMETLHGLFNVESGWSVEDIQECRYCQVSHGLSAECPTRFALKGWLMVARRLDQLA